MQGRLSARVMVNSRVVATDEHCAFLYHGDTRTALQLKLWHDGTTFLLRARRVATTRPSYRTAQDSERRARLSPRAVLLSSAPCVDLLTQTQILSTPCFHPPGCRPEPLLPPKRLRRPVRIDAPPQVR